MRTIADPQCLLSEGFADIRQQFQLPSTFPEAVEQDAREAISRTPDAHADRTALPFATLDPASSRDLDQAFAVEPAGSDIILHYAIADVGWFVREGGPMDQEAWLRGTSQYLPDGKVPLYPPILSEGAASLLPDGDRPAIIFTVRVDPDGGAKLDGVERALIRSRAKLAYETVTADELPAAFADLASRVERAEIARGAARVEPPEQEIVSDDGCYRLQLRPQTLAENQNASLSLASKMNLSSPSAPCSRVSAKRSR